MFFTEQVGSRGVKFPPKRYDLEEIYVPVKRSSLLRQMVKKVLLRKSLFPLSNDRVHMHLQDCTIKLSTDEIYFLP
jgi:hypothetical protein